MFMEKHLENGKTILRTLNDEGYEAYFVGGFVRDALLGRASGDIDITTNATPQVVERLFDRTVLTGKAFGTVTVLIEGEPFEVTTYRKETEYDNHRHPNSISFAETLEEDLSRRDFTVNQLVMDKDGNVYDAFGGKDDLQERRIRTIGDPSERFSEDALRMLRAFRFAAQLDFSIEEGTLDAIEKKRHLIPKISVERIQDELVKLFDAPRKKEAIESMRRTKVDETLNLENGLAILLSLDGPSDHVESFAIMHSVDALDMDHYRFSNDFKNTVETLSQLHKKTFQHGFGPEDLFHYGLSACLKANRINVLRGGKDEQALIRRLDDSLVIRDATDLAFKGKDIKQELPIDHPPHISEILSKLIHEVLRGEIPNTYGALKKRAEEILTLLKERDT